MRGQKELSERPSASILLATPKKKPLGSNGISLSSGRQSSLGLLDTPKKRQLSRSSDSDGRSGGSDLKPEFDFGTPSKRTGRVYSTIHSLHHAYRLAKITRKKRFPIPSFSSTGSSASRPSSRPVSRHGASTSSARRNKVKKADDILYRWEFST